MTPCRQPSVSGGWPPHCHLAPVVVGPPLVLARGLSLLRCPGEARQRLVRSAATSGGITHRVGIVLWIGRGLVAAACLAPLDSFIVLVRGSHVPCATFSAVQ